MQNAHVDIFKNLPQHLLERTRSVGDKASGPTGEFVLYWLHHAMRAHENPALDVAVTFANQLGLPILVYQAISERYPYASDRHHAFMLEGARDLQNQFRERGIAYVFHLERRHHRGPHLRELSNRAALVVTEEVPVDPLAKVDKPAHINHADPRCLRRYGMRGSHATRRPGARPGLSIPQGDATALRGTPSSRLGRCGAQTRGGRGRFAV